MDIFQGFQDDIVQWSDETFGSGDRLLPILNHLKREVDELIETPRDFFEYADCFILLIEAAAKAGLTMQDLLMVSMIKMERNRERVWGPPNPDGSVEHIEE